MDFLSSSASALRVAGLPSTAQEHYHHLLRPPAAALITPQSQVSNKRSPSCPLPFEPQLSTTKLSSSSSLTTKNAHLRFLSQCYIPAVKPTKHFHRTAPSGYAAALLDIARCNNDVDVVEKDVRRFSRLLRGGVLKRFLEDDSVEMEKKAEMLIEVGLHRHVVTLVKMMVEKGKVGLVGEVLEEFKRICDEVRGTRMVLVSSAKKMGEEELLGIAKKVQKLSGAVKVKLRHIVNETLPIPSFVI